MKKDSIEKICILGVGGVGGFFGGTIAWNNDHLTAGRKKIYFVARGNHLEMIRKTGLTLNTKGRCSLVCKPTLATDEIALVPPPDLCLVCVKSYDLENAIRDLRRIIKKDTIVVPLLNGVNIYERVRAILDDGMVLPACVYVETHLEKPGTVTQKGGDGIIRFGPDPRFSGYDPSDLIKTLDSLGIKVRWNADPYPEIWEKYIFIAGYGLATASSGKTIGEVVADPVLRETVRAIMTEIKSIADKMGIELPADIIERSMNKSANFTFGAKTSYQRDVEVKGKPNEGDLYGKAIVEMGERLNVPVPVTTRVYVDIRKKMMSTGND